MSKRSFSIVLTLALLAGLLSSIPAHAQDPPERAIPAAPNITDEHEDANGLTPQGGPSGGVTFSRADIWAGWFTTDAESIYVHIQYAVAGRANYPYFYRVRVDPGTGANCLWFTASVPSALDPSAPVGQLRNTCGGDVRTPGEVALETGPEGTGVVTIKIPRGDDPVLADGSVLKSPWAEVTQFIGTNTANPQSGAPIGGVTAPVIDMTVPGLDYTIGASAQPAPEPSPTEEPPGKGDPPGKGKKKGCPKGKGKKKGACPGKPKPPPVAACPDYAPGEEGAEAETTVVTAAATEEKPIEVTIAAPPGVPEVALGHVFQNIQVDAQEAEGGLYARYEFPIYEDHDIYLNYADGSEAAHVGGFNPVPVPLAFGCCDGTGTGGHSEQGAEQLDGIRTPDCGGYTLDMASFLSEGGDMTLKLWLGEIQNDPAAPGGGLETFYGLMGIRR